MLATKDRISTRHSQKPCLTSKLRSSGALIKPKASPFCPNAGSSNARLRGSTAAEGSPKIGKTSIARRSHSCASLQSASCSENSAIPSDVSGQTLIANATKGTTRKSIGKAAQRFFRPAQRNGVGRIAVREYGEISRETVAEMPTDIDVETFEDEVNLVPMP